MPEGYSGERIAGVKALGCPVMSGNLYTHLNLKTLLD